MAQSVLQEEISKTVKGGGGYMEVDTIDEGQGVEEGEHRGQCVGTLMRGSGRWL